MKFRQGSGEFERDVWVNMSQVCHIAPGGAGQSVLTFAAVIDNEPAYLVVNEQPNQIGNRSEWRV